MTILLSQEVRVGTHIFEEHIFFSIQVLIINNLDVLNSRTPEKLAVDT